MTTPVATFTITNNGVTMVCQLDRCDSTEVSESAFDTLDVFVNLVRGPGFEKSKFAVSSGDWDWLQDVYVGNPLQREIGKHLKIVA